MQKFRPILLTFFYLIALSCNGNDDNTDPVLEKVQNLVVITEISGATSEHPEGDGSGTVTFTATADHASTFRLTYNGETLTMRNGEATLVFDHPGIWEYEVKVVAAGAVSSQISETITVMVNREFETPSDLLTLLTKGDSQTWRIKSEAAGHMGVGPKDGTSPEYWMAQAFEKEFTSMYDDTYTFGNDKSFTHHTEGAVYGKATPLTSDLGSTNATVNAEDEIENYPLADYSGNWQYGPLNEKETLYLSEDGFLGFYVGGTHAYTILARTETDMVLRTEGVDGQGWFFILTTEEKAEIPADPDYTNLIWQDEFSTAGDPDDQNWNFDIGRGSNGWGNNEAQYYTNRSENVTVENGFLKITAKKENYEGAEYTSARLKTQDKFSFTYGRVDVKAKLAGGGGTWPAIWMLGSNITSVGWPACGEVDIMEYVGNRPGTVQSAIHNSSSSGATVNYKSTSITNETSEFHVYSVIWSEEQISFLIDGERYYTYRPVIRDDGTWPFDAKQFLILNVAMGGNLGGSIDPSLTTSVMEIDYVRIYQ